MQLDIKLIEKIWALKNVTLVETFQGFKDRLIALIDSDNGRYIFKIASPWKDEDALRKDMTVFDVLPAHGRPYISKVFKAKSGENFSAYGDRFAYIYEYVEGINPNSTAETFRKLAEITADLHTIINYPHKTDFDPQYIVAHSFIENAKTFLFAEEYLRIAGTLPNFSKFSQVLIHTDISPKNSIERKDGSLVLIDWDDVGVGPVVLDLGYILGQFITEELEVKKDLASAFFNTYFSKRTITEEDKKAIFDGCLFFHLMYIIYGDIDKRWKKIRWLVKNRESVESLIP